MTRHSSNQERGVVAIIFAVIIGLLLLTTTTMAARLSASELSQSTQVDRSEQAYYAAEAGVEDAVRRIDAAPTDQDVKTVFPQQFDPTSGAQVGDRFRVASETGAAFPDANPLIEDPSVGDIGQISWRTRKVFQQSSSFFGTQVKDESVQFDTTDLRRRCPSQTADTNGGPDTSYLDLCNYNASNGTYESIFARYGGVEYCWTPIAGPQPLIEWTDVSYPASDPSSITTMKNIVGPGSSITGRADGATIRVVPGTGNNENCLSFTIAAGTSNRYIFRVKPLYPSAGSAQSPNNISFRARIIENPTPTPGQGLFIPNGDYLIDVVGQSGDIRRRIVARKERNGRLIGVFDYVMYSGSTSDPLCKGGVVQPGIDYSMCSAAGVGPIGNQTGYSYATPSYVYPSPPYGYPSPPYTTPPYATPPYTTPPYTTPPYTTPMYIYPYTYPSVGYIYPSTCGSKC